MKPTLSPPAAAATIEKHLRLLEAAGLILITATGLQAPAADETNATTFLDSKAAMAARIDARIMLPGSVPDIYMDCCTTVVRHTVYYVVVDHRNIPPHFHCCPFLR